MSLPPASPSPSNPPGWGPPPPAVPDPSPPATDWVAPTAASGPPRRRRRLWLVVVGIVVVVGGAVGYQMWQTEQGYQAGHAAYLAADCATAVEHFEAIADGDGDTAVKAQAELQECDALLTADGLAAVDPAGAVLAHAELQTKYPAGPLFDASVANARGLMTDTPPATLATVELCAQLGVLEAQGMIVATGETLPPLLVACGATSEASGSYADALLMLDRFLADYPDHMLASAAEEAFARVTIADAAAAGAGTLPAPNAVGSSDEEGGLVTVIIQNDSPKSMGLVFQGPDVRVGRLAPCTDCIEYRGLGPDACPEQGPIGKYVLQPGVYDVVVKASSDTGVTPFRGTWTLQAGDEYYSCFYLVTQ